MNYYQYICENGLNSICFPKVYNQVFRYSCINVLPYLIILELWKRTWNLIKRLRLSSVLVLLIARYITALASQLKGDKNI